ncbi:MAG: Hsp70 family protein, partial [Egibacteraceae bacterium]
QIEVTFDIDANGIVHVSAKDRATGKEQSMTITGQTAMPKDDIERMVKDAEAYAEEDRKRKEEADARNEADNLMYQTDKLVTDSGDKISAEHKAKLEETQGKVREALGGQDVAAIRSATEELMRVSQEVGQALYAAGAADQAGQQTAQSAAGDAAGQAQADEDEGIVDAEVVDEGDEGAA